MYSFFKIFFTIVFRILFRCKVTGAEYIPLQGGVIIAANHLSLWDPPLLGIFSPRPIHFMAKAELFKIPVLGRIFKKLNAFPVRRGAADRSAIKTSIALLQSEKCLGVFPEGTRSKTGKLGTAEPGIAMLAVKTGAPIIPAAIIGTNKVFHCKTILPQFEVRFGKPIMVPAGKLDKETLEKITQVMMCEISNLQDAS